MFGSHSGSGSIGTLTILAAVALGALITPLDCTAARAQQLDANLKLVGEESLFFQEADLDGAVPSLERQLSKTADEVVSIRGSADVRGRRWHCSDTV
jgi:hypothetical protein